jgi:3-hydroxyisobutyrate dehydrogenase-like beta-hydroxyacid dehydrogenase
VAREAAYEVFAASAIAAPFVHYKREAFEHPGRPPVAFSLDLVEKDLELALALAAQSGAAMEQAATNHRVVQAAVAAGLGDHDLSELATYLRSPGPDPA